MTASPPVRVKRSGWLGMMPLTREQVRKACLYAEAWARPITWKNTEDLIHGVAWSIGEQLNRPIHAVLCGAHDVDDLPVLRIHIGEFQHHIAVRDTRMLENSTLEMLLGDERVEAIVSQRMLAAKTREAERKQMFGKVKA